MPSEARQITKMKARYGWDCELEGEGEGQLLLGPS